MVVCQIPLSLPAEVDVDMAQKFATCRLIRAGAADWPELKPHRIRITYTRTALQAETYSCLHLLHVISVRVRL